MWVWSGILLEDMDALPPVHPIKMVPQYTSGTGRPWAPCEGALALSNCLGESDLIYLGELILLNHQEPVLVDIQLCYVY